MPAEPTSEWGKELKAAVGTLQQTVSDGFRDLRNDVKAVNKQIDDPNVGIHKLIRDLKEETKLIPGVKTMLAIGGVIIGLIVAANSSFTILNTTTLFGVHNKLIDFKGDISNAKAAADNAKTAADNAKTAADTITAEANGLTTEIGKVKNSFDQMDQKLDKRLQDFDGKLNSLGQKIADLDKAALSKQQLDEIQAKVNAVEGKLDGLRQAVGGPTRRTVRVSEYRSLRGDDRQRDAPPQHVVFSIRAPEGLDPNLVEEVSATFPAGTIQRPGVFVTVTTRFDAKTGQLVISLIGVVEESIQMLLDSPDGLRVSITYISREP